MKIIVDVREKAKIQRFRDFVSSKDSAIINEVVIEQSLVSDVHTEDMLIGIERKAKDFVPSMISDQIDKQLTELCNNFARPYLFVEYDGIKDLILDNTNISPKALIGMFTSIMARHNVSVLFTGNYKSSPLYVPMVVRTIEKHYDGKNETKVYSPIRVHKKPMKRQASPQEVKLDIISRIPRLGAKKGVSLLEKYDYSISKISTAPIEELMEIKGIGKTLAQHIHEVLK